MYLPRSLISHLYNHLLKTHHPLSPPVLILPSLDTDALCACRILTALLKRDYIPHKIQPVSGYGDLTRAGAELVRPMKITEGGSGGVVICLGVGGLVDLANLLGLDSEDGQVDGTGQVEVWVLDARRPWNLTNVFGDLGLAASPEDEGTRIPKTGIVRGCIQRSYQPGQGGVIVFDDGDIADELNAEQDAYAALTEMPDVEEEEEEDEDDDDDGSDNEDDDVNDPQDEHSLDSSGSRKRKSWSGRDEGDQDSDEERPRQRRRSNSGSSISTGRGASPAMTHSRSDSPVQDKPTKAPSARQLRKKLRELRRSHEIVLEQYYALGMSYSEPVSSLAYSLASELGREDNDLLWLAIVGVTSLELSGHTSTGLGTAHNTQDNVPRLSHRGWRASRSSRTYALLRDEVRRLNPPPHDQSPLWGSAGVSSSSRDSSIRLTPDPRFMLLRHWSLYDSMLHSPYLAARLHVWNDAGVKRLHKLLAKMGISLTQCKQGYIHMDMDLRKTLRQKLLKYAGVYGLEDLVPVGEGRSTYDQEGWGFIRSWGWKAQLSAVDVGVIVSALLEVGTHHGLTSSTATNRLSQASEQPEVADRSEALIPRFFAAYDALAPNQPTQLLASIPQAQQLLRALLRTGSSLLAKHQIRHLRAFRMGVVKDGPDLPLFANSPGALVKLALWVSEAVAVSERDKKGTDEATPLVIGALDEPRGTYLVVGVGGGIGGADDVEARKEKAEATAKKQAEKQARKQAREERRAAKAAAKEATKTSETNDELDEESDESESESDDDDDDDDQDLTDSRGRGHGRNRFGITFQEVVEETNARVKIDSFDHCVVEVKKEDLGGFLEGLSLKSVVGR